VEKDGRRLRLVATPLDIASLLTTQVFENMATAVLTSATLATQENFDFIKERLGLPGAKTLLLRSPFDYEKQVALYLPEAMSEPGSEGFEDDLITGLKEILGVTLGRTMVLFTSYGLLNRVYEMLHIPGVEIMRQGDMENYRLLKAFRKKRHAVLFGTYTFWQGVDIPGDDLQCVVITKLPFAVPDEPVIEARLEMLVRKGKNPFREYQVPQAAIMLKQGFGRLIRTRTDRGAVVVMDPRIRTRGYGAQFLKSLPECKITASLEDVRDMLGGEHERSE
jgi:ATP-dependent DNA helicase DinG